MPSFRDHIPLAIITVTLSIAIFVLFRELKSVREQAAIGARFAASFQEQQQQVLKLCEAVPFQPPTSSLPKEIEEVREDEKPETSKQASGKAAAKKST